MSSYILSLLVIGLLILSVTLGSGWIGRLPISYALIYLLVGFSFGPYGIHLIQIEPNTQFLERITEFVVLISLFGCGLKVNRSLKVKSWRLTTRLIGLLMPFSIIAIAIIAHNFLDFNWGVAILLGAILAPTDPVLASEVQLAHLNDRNELRFGLTSEGGLNDALAFPFVYFGLRWIKDNNWQNWLHKWVAIDLIWAIFAGIIAGAVIAKTIVWIDKRLQKMRPVDDILQDFVALAILLVSYAAAELVNGYGFLAVFVAGIVTQRSYGDLNRHLGQLEFIEQIERLMEVAIIVLLGSLLRVDSMLRFLPSILLVGGLLLFVVRPVGVWISTIGQGYKPLTRLLVGWFGVRGVGSLYYLFYALGKGFDGEVAEAVTWIAIAVVMMSIALHGISTTPLMKLYELRGEE
ncbi:MAG: sodium:proton antiporter [Cyanobacteriota bacterium]|nr:sodium:proton antiporter [Cyanobacteriota bacterium]